MKSQAKAIIGCLAAIVLCIVGCQPRPTPKTPRTELIVSAASSLTDALRAIQPEFERANPDIKIRFNFAASGVLQQQIENGAPADLFASASPVEMDKLEKQNLLANETRVVFAANRLALIVPAKTTTRVKSWSDLGRASVRRVALSDPKSVPSGRYAKQTLEHRALWQAIEKKAIWGENVRQTLAYVASGDVDAGIVFATDARIEAQRVQIVTTAIPGKDHTPILYPAAVVKRSPSPAEARRFVAFLSSNAAQRIFQQFGFTAP